MAIAADADGEGEEQLDLLGLPPLRAGAILAERRGRGRPPGARNKRTEDLVAWLLGKYPSPLEGLLQMANARVDELAAQLGCTPLEALQEKRHAAIAALPYIHQRQAIAVDVTQRNVVHLTLEMGGAEALDETVMDQWVTVEPVEKSDSGKSDSDR